MCYVYKRHLPNKQQKKLKDNFRAVLSLQQKISLKYIKLLNCIKDIDSSVKLESKQLKDQIKYKFDEKEKPKF